VTTRARILREERTEGARVISPDQVLAPSAKRILRERAEASAEAQRVVENAKTEASGMLERARREAREEAAAAIEVAKHEADVQGAARWIAVRVSEEQRLERDTDRILSVAIAMAERLLRTALELDSARVASIAASALAEARGARRAVIDAHPLDADALRHHLPGAGVALSSIEVRDDPALARGDLRLHTDLGAIDARLGVRFERLAWALRDALPQRPSLPERPADG
jgi:flagellar biosynthesis/type III secretory pathway protein FliH